MNIEIQQPKPFDLVDKTILIAGNAVAFEATVSVTVSDGHDEVTGFVMAGGTSIRQFQGEITIPDDTEFKLDRLFVTLADDGGGGEGPIPTAMVPVLFAPLILPGYTGYREHEVAAGDTLSKLAKKYYDDANKWQPIQRANQPIVTDPNLIFVGQILRIPLDF